MDNLQKMKDNAAWISVDDRMPDESETVGGRVPAIDVDGYLIFAVLVGNNLLGTSNINVAYWLPVRAPNVN